MGVLVKHVGACGVSMWFMHVQTIANLFKWRVKKSSPQLLLASTPRWASSIWSWRISQHVWICIKQAFPICFKTYIKLSKNVRIGGSESHEFALRINKIGPEYSDIYHLTKLAHLIAKIVISACRFFFSFRRFCPRRSSSTMSLDSMGWFVFFCCPPAEMLSNCRGAEISGTTEAEGDRCGCSKMQKKTIRMIRMQRADGRRQRFSSKTQLRWHICDCVYRAEAAVSKAYPHRAGLEIWFNWTIFNVS